MTPPPVDDDAAASPSDDEPAAAALARYTRTDAGRDEVRSRALALTRSARNLLLIIEPSRPAAEWIAMVQGCGVNELQALREAGLVALAAPAARSGAAPKAAAAPAGPSLSQALARLDYRTLYDRITAQARPQLGLIKGYRMILEVERCDGPDALRALALQFVEQVREAEGRNAALALANKLAAPPASDSGAGG